MSIQLDQNDFLARAKDLSRNNLLFIFSIIKAASIGLGVATFLYLFIDLPSEWSWSGLGNQMPKFLLWVVSYAGLLVTFDVAMFTSIFLVHIPKRSETFYTFLLVGLEGLQFAILKPSTDQTTIKVMSVELIVWWYAIFFFYCLTIAALVIYAKREISISSFKEDMKPFVIRFLKKFNLGIIFSLLGAISSAFIFFFLSFTNYTSSKVIILSSLIYTMLFYIVFEIHHKQRRIFEKNLLALKETQKGNRQIKIKQKK